MQNYDIMIIDMINAASRAWKASPLVLGGIPTASGGAGGPPGGFVGYLPQKRVAYDTSEAETDYTPPSGMTLLDNLNHIRFRLGALESGYNGHIIEDSTTEFAQRLRLQFLGNVTVVDDPGNDTTIINVGSGIVFPAADTNYYVARNSGWEQLPSYTTVLEDLSSQIDGSNRDFYMTSAGINLKFFLNGLLQLNLNGVNPYSYIWDEWSNHIYWADEFIVAGDNIFVEYQTLGLFPAKSTLLEIPNLQVWWSADSITASDGDFILSMPDSARTGKTGFSFEGFAPTYKENIIGTKPALQFSDYDVMALDSSLSYAQATFFLLWSKLTSGNDFIFGDTSTSFSYEQLGNDWYAAPGVSQTISMTLNTPYLKCMTFNGSSVERFTNGVSHGTQITSDGVVGQILGGFLEGTFDANVFELVIYDRVLTETERQSVELELLRKYGMA